MIQIEEQELFNIMMDVYTYTNKFVNLQVAGEHFIKQIEQIKDQNSNTVIDNDLVELDINHTFWSEALSTIDKNRLIELCEQFNIPTKGKDRNKLASNLSKRIKLNKKMKIIVGFE